MTSYNRINGYHAASNYDMLTTILRGEWSYQGMVMTDWWACMNDPVEKGVGTRQNTAAMNICNFLMHAPVFSRPPKDRNAIEKFQATGVSAADAQDVTKEPRLAFGMNLSLDKTSKTIYGKHIS